VDIGGSAKLELVDKFCYLGDMLSVDGDADAAVEVRIRIGWNKFRQLVLLLKSVEFDDDVALLLSVAGLVMGPHVTSESEIGGTDSAALRTSWTCLRLVLPASTTAYQ